MAISKGVVSFFALWMCNSKRGLFEACDIGNALEFSDITYIVCV